MKLSRFLLAFIFLCGSWGAFGGAEEPLTSPKLTNNPSFDVVVTNVNPLLSFFNASGGSGQRTYEIQIDIVPTFDSEYLIEYNNVPESDEYVTGKLGSSNKDLQAEHKLKDKTRYHWRVRAVDSNGIKGPWAGSRFYLDTESNDHFMALTRVSVKKVEVSTGQNPKNIVDIDDPGQTTFWQAVPPGLSEQWVKFDFGQRRQISRIWMLSNPGARSGWLKDLEWQKKSRDGRGWEEIPGAKIEDNDTFRNVIAFKPVVTRYMRLLITGWHGYAPQLNAVIFYSPGNPPIPKTPEEDYVLIVGNQQDGGTFTDLAGHVECLGLGLKTLIVPHYEVSLKMIDALKNKPVAIILSGNNADYPNLPMFEFNGEYEIIRKSDIPILGICCGHQQLAMAYGYTYARSMGWEDISDLEDAGTRAKIKMTKDDPVFKGVPDPFTAAEIHGWAVVKLSEDFEVIAESTYIQAIKSEFGMIYGEQFHAEIAVPYNEGMPYLENFLKMAIGRKTK